MAGEEVEIKKGKGKGEEGWKVGEKGKEKKGREAEHPRSFRKLAPVRQTVNYTPRSVNYPTIYLVTPICRF